jgi:hypothetical protein
VTEPAIGYGGGLGLLFFHRNPQASAEGRPTPPDISALAAFGTENGSKGGAAGHLGFSEDRRWRYAAGVGSASVNLTWYGDSGQRARRRRFQPRRRVRDRDVRRRFGESDWWAGLRYVGADLKARFGTGRDDPGFAPASSTRRLERCRHRPRVRRAGQHLHAQPRVARAAAGAALLRGIWAATGTSITRADRCRASSPSAATS